MAWGEACGAAVLSAAGYERGDDLALVVAALGIRLVVCPGLPSPAVVDDTVMRGGSARYSDDQVDLARAIALWAAARTGHYLDPVWLERFVTDITPCRRVSRERASVRVRVRARA